MSSRARKEGKKVPSFFFSIHLSLPHFSKNPTHFLFTCQLKKEAKKKGFIRMQVFQAVQRSPSYIEEFLFSRRRRFRPPISRFFLLIGKINFAPQNSRRQKKNPKTLSRTLSAQHRWGFVREKKGWWWSKIPLTFFYTRVSFKFPPKGGKFGPAKTKKGVGKKWA